MTIPLYALKIKKGTSYSYQFLLGILNSKFIGWLFRKKFQISDLDTFPQIMISDILEFPIPEFDAIKHNQLVQLVSQMLDFNKSLRNAILPHDKTVFSRQIEATDKAIDTLVYELYGLASNEIRIIEGN